MKDILKFLGIILVAMIFRAGAFFYPHFSWDQIYYASLAMKLDASGFSGYNLHGVVFERTPGAGGVEIRQVKDAPNDLLSYQKRHGLYYYDEPLFYEPPAFPYLIKFSHDIFAKGQKFLYIDYKAWINGNDIHRPYFFKNEFYKTIVPFVFSLLSISLVYWFSVIYINPGTACLAALFLAVNPVDIMAATKTWTDCSAAFFFTATLMFFYMAYKKDSYLFLTISGICCCLAMLTRISCIILVPIVMIYGFILFLKKKPRSLKCILDGKLILFMILVLAGTLPWFMAVTRTFGSPLHLPYQKNLQDLFPFVYFTFHRPWFTYAVNIICQNPLWVLFTLSPWFGLEGGMLSLLAVWTVVPMLVLTVLPIFAQVSIEDRYALPVYPAIAMMTGFVLTEINKKFSDRGLLQNVVLNILILGSLLWSLKLGIDYTYIKLKDLIAFPF